MDPISALIGGGMSLIGGLFNRSSQQSINAANLQNQMWSAEGGYLPGLVANANKAGLNPLAVLGQHGPNMAVQVGEQPGAGLQQAGQVISRMDIDRHELDMQRAREEIARNAALTKQTNIDNAIKEETMRGIESGKYIPPGVSQPASETSWPGMFKSWETNNPLSPRPGGFLDRWANPASYIPEFDSWRRFMPRDGLYDSNSFNTGR